jgi:hypothetical protein
MNRRPSFRDVEKLSALLDGELNQAEAARWKARLESDPELRAVYEQLQVSRAVLRKMPARRAPRNFTLTPKMVGQRPPMPKVYPAFRFATLAATFLLALTFAVNFVVPIANQHIAAAPVAYGRGGGGIGSGGGPGEQPTMEAMQAPAQSEAATEAPAAEAPMLTAPRPTATEGAVEKSAPDMGNQVMAPTPEPTPVPQTNADTLTAPTPVASPPAPSPQQKPVPRSWQAVLLGIALLAGFVTLLLRSINIHKWRAKTK